MMRSIRSISVMAGMAAIIGLCGVTFCAYATVAEDKVIEVSASVQESPPAITLNWPLDAGSDPIQVYRKDKDGTSWGAAIAVLPDTAVDYVDTAVVSGVPYEYLVYKPSPADPIPNGRFGFAYAGIDVPLTEFRGTVILVVDNTYTVYRYAGCGIDAVGTGPCWRRLECHTT